MSEDTKLFSSIIFLAVLLGALLFYLREEIDKKHGHQSYQAWIKQTENPKNLSYEEFYALYRSCKTHDELIIMPPVFIPMR